MEKATSRRFLIEPSIRPLCRILWGFGMTTLASCEGHFPQDASASAKASPDPGTYVLVGDSPSAQRLVKLLCRWRGTLSLNWQVSVWKKRYGFYAKPRGSRWGRRRQAEAAFRRKLFRDTKTLERLLVVHRWLNRRLHVQAPKPGVAVELLPDGKTTQASFLSSRPKEPQA